MEGAEGGWVAEEGCVLGVHHEQDEGAAEKQRGVRMGGGAGLREGAYRFAVSSCTAARQMLSLSVGSMGGVKRGSKMRFRRARLTQAGWKMARLDPGSEVSGDPLASGNGNGHRVFVQSVHHHALEQYRQHTEEEKTEGKPLTVHLNEQQGQNRLYRRVRSKPVRNDHESREPGHEALPHLARFGVRVEGSDGEHGEEEVRLGRLGVERREVDEGGLRVKVVEVEGEVRLEGGVACEGVVGLSDERLEEGDQLKGPGGGGMGTCRDDLLKALARRLQQ